jgi:hypothetical protein
MHLQSVHVLDDEHNEQSDMSLLTVLESNTDLSNVASADLIQEESQSDQQATSTGGKKSTMKFLILFLLSVSGLIRCCSSGIASQSDTFSDSFLIIFLFVLLF